MKRTQTWIIGLPSRNHIHLATNVTAKFSIFFTRDPNPNIKANRKQSKLMQANRNAIQANRSAIQAKRGAIQANRSAIQAAWLIWFKLGATKAPTLDSVRYKNVLPVTRWPLRTPIPLQSILWPIIDSILITFRANAIFAIPTQSLSVYTSTLKSLLSRSFLNKLTRLLN